MFNSGRQNGELRFKKGGGGGEMRRQRKRERRPSVIWRGMVMLFRWGLLHGSGRASVFAGAS